MININPVSETALLIGLGETIDTELAVSIGRAAERIRKELSEELIEVIPSYTTIFVQYHPLKIAYDELAEQLELIVKSALLSAEITHNTSSEKLKLPVYYGEEVGPDLADLALLRGYMVDEVISIHSETVYTVCAIGFSPGFAFLGTVDAKIATPRKKIPRKQLPAGSVGIADQQTGVYSSASPGGWQIIGNCPIPLFNPEQAKEGIDDISPFSVGQKVQFYPVTKREFFNLGGALWPHWK